MNEVKDSSIGQQKVTDQSRFQKHRIIKSTRGKMTQDVLLIGQSWRDIDVGQ